jgi:hypothetical protein
VVLKILTEHDFQDSLKNGGSTGNGAYTWKGTTSRWLLPVGPKLVFDQMAAPVPEIMDGSLLYILACYILNI